MLPSLGPLELVIILVIIIIIFGVGRLPEVGGAIGKAMREFRRASEGLDEEEKPGGTEAAEGAEGTKGA